MQNAASRRRTVRQPPPTRCWPFVLLHPMATKTPSPRMHCARASKVEQPIVLCAAAMLVRNYRSSEELLLLSSRMFYKVGIFLRVLHQLPLV